MVRIEEMQNLMQHPKQVRNMSVIAHVDHGKTTLTDSLINVRKEDVGSASLDKVMKQQAERGITIKSTGISLTYDLPDHLPPVDGQSREYLVNLIDSPGHVDFSSEVTAALRLTDGALVVIDCVEGVAVQTKTVLRQALAERIRPVLTINKLDRAFLELTQEPEEMYQSFLRSIESANIIVAEVHDEALGALEFDPLLGNVAFSAGLQGWAFTLSTFARFYAKRFGISEEKMLTRLWGDHFYDPESKKFLRRSQSPSGKPLKRAFCEFVIEPIYRVYNATMERNMERLPILCKKLDIAFNKDWLDILEAKKLAKAVLSEWLPAADALLEMVVRHLPSPHQAQRYRTENLYQGPLDDATAQAMRSCDPNGPLVMFVAKMVPTPDYSRFFAFGRVFSGTLSAGAQVHILGSNYVPGKKDDYYQGRVQNVLTMLGKKMESVGAVPCGNTVALSGVDKYLAKTGTLVESMDSHPIKSMHYSVAPVMRVAVKPKIKSDMPKLSKALKLLSKFDQLVQVTSTDNGEYVVAGAGELHLEVCLRTLEEDFLDGVEVVVSEPVVEYCETILDKSPQVLAKSSNKLNRLWVECEPMTPELTDALEAGSLPVDAKSQIAFFRDDHGWDPNEARKLWSVAPEESPLNALVENAAGVQYLKDIQSSVISGFDGAVRDGPLTGEMVRGVKIAVKDAQIHSDSMHRGPGQLIPAATRAIKGAILSAKPALLEPIYLLEITAPETVMGGIYSVLNQRRGEVVSDTQHPTLPLHIVEAHMPVAASFKFTEKLREETGGQAFPTVQFSHWALVPGDPYVAGSMCHDVVLAIRERKGLPPGIPEASQFLDKL